MRPIILAFLALPLAAPSADAALSGFYDSAAQIKLILENGQVADALHQLPVEAITRTRTHDDGRTDWQLRTQRCTATVQLAPKQRSTIGPRSWTLRSISACTP